MRITSLKARQVLDSRGKPTVEVELNGHRAICPSGASTGKHEALELRDEDKFHVSKAVNNVRIVAKHVANKNLNQTSFDKILCDLAGPNKQRLGGNTTTALSMAFARAHGDVSKITNKRSIPVPFMNVINGGAHAGNDLAIQEFMIVPIKFPNYSQACYAGVEIYQQLKKIIKSKHGKNATNVGDEGGFAPPLKITRDALDLLASAIDECGYQKHVKIAMDAAASQFFTGNYNIDGKFLSPKKMIDYYMDLAKTYPIISIEDPFDEEDFQSFAALKKKAKRFLVVGDDLTTTNTERIEKAIKANSCDALLVKINQIGTVTETLEAIKMVREDNWEIIISHRSGDTEDSFIADFAVGTGAFAIKTGAPCRSERVAKYNQLLRLEEAVIKFQGRSFKLP